MSVTEAKKLYEVNEIHLDGISEMIAKLGPRFAERAARADEGDLFVAENFVELKAHGLVAAGVPKELGEAVLATPSLLICCVSWVTTAAPLRWRFPCTRIRSQPPLGAGGIKAHRLMVCLNAWPPKIS